MEETSFRAKSIEGVGTSTTAFVGPTRKGPITGGRLQANRRAVIRFVHTVSNHPLVMP